MTSQLVAYAVLVSLFLAVAGPAMEWLAGAWRQPRRWVWAALLAASGAIGIGVPMSRRAPAPVGLPIVASGFSRTTSPVPAAAPVEASAAVVESGFSRTTIESIVRRFWPLASAALLLLYAAGHLTLALRRRRWAEGHVNGVPVLVSRDIGPAVIGILRPRIVLPEWALESETRARDLMLRHECEHLRARDPLLIQLARLVVLVMPWNPAAWWMVSRLKLAIELDCDARVLRSATDFAAYGDVLLRVATRRAPGQFMLGPAMLERSSSLARRIAAMHPTRLRFVVLRAAAACGVALAILGTIVLLPAPALRAAAAIPDVPPASPRHDVTLPCMKDGPLACVLGAAPQNLNPPSDDVYQPGNGVTWPTLIRQVEPQYTRAAMDAKIQGTVYLTGVVETDGTVGRIRVLKSLDRVHGLDDAAVDAAKKWQFKPCAKDGKPVVCAIQLELDFRLDEARVTGYLWAENEVPIPNGTVQIRNTSTGQIVKSVRTNARGEFDFPGIRSGPYVIEYVDSQDSSRIIAVGAPFTVGRGATVATFVRTGTPQARPAEPAPEPAVPGNGVSWPVLIRQVEAQYTQSAKDARIQGTVYLTGVVETDGTVGSLRVSKSLDKVHGLDEAAVDAAKKWTFKPCTKDGKSVRCTIQLEIDFRLRPDGVQAAVALPAPNIAEQRALPPTQNAPADGIYQPGNGVSWPVPIGQINPSYTRAAMDADIQGTVSLTGVVEADGSVGRLRVAKSLDSVHGLDQAGVDAAKKWLFKPCTKDGKPVACAIQLELEFRLH